MKRMALPSCFATALSHNIRVYALVRPRTGPTLERTRPSMYEKAEVDHATAPEQKETAQADEATI